MPMPIIRFSMSSPNFAAAAGARSAPAGNVYVKSSSLGALVPSSGASSPKCACSALRMSSSSSRVVDDPPRAFGLLSQRVYQLIIRRLLEQTSRTLARSISVGAASAGTAAPPSRAMTPAPLPTPARVSSARRLTCTIQPPFNLGKT